MIVTLIGPRSVGKTTVCKFLARSLSWLHIDFDEHMEQKLKRQGGIEGYTKKHGWDKYDERRRVTLVSLLKSIKHKNIILDWGGGGLQVCGKLLKDNSAIILLLPHQNREKGLQILYQGERKRAHFAYWTDQQLKEKTRNDYIERIPLMRKLADHVIYRQADSPQKLATKIVNLVKKKI